MDIRRDFVFVSCEYTSIYRIEDDCGTYERSDPQSVRRWICGNAVGTLKHGEEALVYDGSVLCGVSERMIDKNPPCPSENGQKVSYRLELIVRVSPRGKPLPSGLVEALKRNGYEQQEEK